MNINNPEELKKYFEEFKELVKNEEADKAMHMLEELLKSIEEQVKVRRAGSIDARGNISIIPDLSMKQPTFPVILP